MRSRQELNSLALKTRRELGEDAYSPIDIFSIVNGWKSKKITIVRYPLSERISGMCTKEDDDIIIVINSNTSYGRQRFTLAHEIYHILYEENNQRVICDMSMNSDKSDSEKEADQFASYLLMPFDAMYQYFHDKGKLAIEEIVEGEQYFQISHKAMMFRLESENLISKEDVEALKNISISQIATKLGFDKTLYQPTNKEFEYFTTGEYIRKVEKLSEKELISAGKRKELLLDAYRSDMVFGFDEGGLILDD